MTENNPLIRDFNDIFALTIGLWEELRGKHLFVTGGTGFFGIWLLESFVLANEKLNLGASALVLTRDINSFQMRAPRLACNSAIRFHKGDIRNFNFPDGEFSHIIHAAATSAISTFNNEDPLIKFDTIVNGTRHILDFAIKCGAKKFLLTSSGVAYGPQPHDMKRIPESYCGALDSTDINSVWGESKRVAEFLCAYYAQKYGIEAKIARCFSFVGPHLPLDIHYAIGNFIRDGLNGGPIKIHGDGTHQRSYLYATDLVIWLWTILFNGKSCRLYNVGSEEEVSIVDLANLVARNFKKPIEIIVEKLSDTGAHQERYIPSVNRVKKELGLTQTINLNESIKRTIMYYSVQRQLDEKTII